MHNYYVQLTFSLISCVLNVQAQLRYFIPEMLKFSTGKSKPGWGKPECRPPWWPDDVPWANVRSDVRDDETKRTVNLSSSWLFPKMCLDCLLSDVQTLLSFDSIPIRVSGLTFIFQAWDISFLRERCCSQEFFFGWKEMYSTEHVLGDLTDHGMFEGTKWPRYAWVP